MKRFIFTTLLFFGSLVFVKTLFAQIPTKVLVQIVRAEDERRYDSTLEKLMQNADARIRVRAALAAGRIGDEKAVAALASLLKDDSVEVRTMAAFALGGTESARAIPSIVAAMTERENPVAVRARAIEAAGKIAAANPKDENFKMLGEVILQTLDFENARRSAPDDEIILAGLTAVLRARPADADKVAINFLRYSNARIRADALNTLARLRSKNANAESRALLQKDFDPIVRANAARMLGVGEDKTSIDLLLNAAAKDSDSRVRVSAIRALGSLKDSSIADKLLARGENLLTEFQKSKTFKSSEKNELLEIITALGNILRATHLEKAWIFINKFRAADNYSSPESMTALARIAPEIYLDSLIAEHEDVFTERWQIASATFQGANEIAKLEPGQRNDATKAQTLRIIFQILGDWNKMPSKTKAVAKTKFAIPDLLSAFAAFKIPNLSELIRPSLATEQDVQIRVAIAGILAEQPATKENIEALKSAFTKSLLTDKLENDAQLAILDALYKLDKKSAVGTFLVALDVPDYLVRKKAFEILKDADLQKDFPGIPASLENALAKKKNQVLPYAAYTGTKLGQILNSQADYVRAVSRKNGTIKAVLTTTKGNFTIDFFPEDAPLTVDNFVKLARGGYFNGIEVHRVVPNFVMQDGDPRGDGNGGPGWQIRCEINMIAYDRGAVGMALSGKDTGGSQWFVTHSPQPHLDGGYTVFGRVSEAEMKIVDSIVRGDKILSVKIVETDLTRKARRSKAARGKN